MCEHKNDSIKFAYHGHKIHRCSGNFIPRRCKVFSSYWKCNDCGVWKAISKLPYCYFDVKTRVQIDFYMNDKYI